MGFCGKGVIIAQSRDEAKKL